MPDAAYNNCLYSEGFSQTVDSNNRIIGFGYDAAGNQTGIPGGNSYTYDAENHLVSVSSAGGNYTYTYDGDGDRVEKSNGEIYWYTSGGEVLDETDLSGNLTSEYIFFGGARIARRDASGNVFYYLADHLGSSREIVQAGQTTACYDADFYPFGGERAYTNSCQQNYKFTGKERDPESGLDNFEARYYGSSIARFTSPDDPFVGWQLNDPQSLNLYAYVQDNPINDVDPTGHMTSVCFTAGGSPATTAFASSDPCGFAANPMDPASDQEDPQTTYMTNADMGDPEGFGRANNIEAGEQQYVHNTVEGGGWTTSTSSSYSTVHVGDNGNLVGEDYTHMTITAHDPPAWADASNAGGSWLGTFPLRAYVFAHSMGRFFVDEFKQGGCANTFFEGVEQADILGPVLGGSPGFGETAIKGQAATVAARYAAGRALTVPLRSSVVRGILETGEEAAGAFGPGYLVGQELWGLGREGQAMYEGTCH